MRGTDADVNVVAVDDSRASLARRSRSASDVDDDVVVDVVVVVKGIFSSHVDTTSM